MRPDPKDRRGVRGPLERTGRLDHQERRGLRDLSGLMGRRGQPERLALTERQGLRDLRGLTGHRGRQGHKDRPGIPVAHRGLSAQLERLDLRERRGLRGLPGRLDLLEQQELRERLDLLERRDRRDQKAVGGLRVLGDYPGRLLQHLLSAHSLQTESLGHPSRLRPPC